MGTHNLGDLATQAATYQLASDRAISTRESYSYDWRSFVEWCRETKRSSLPASAETVVLYLTHLLDRKLKVSTAKRHYASINHFHTMKGLGLPAPCGSARNLLIGAQRTLCYQPEQKRPLSIEDLRAICAALRAKGDTRAVRDRSILLLGIATGLRRSNIVMLNVGDISFQAEGVVVHVHREKNDQMGRGREIGVARGAGADTCPVQAILDWLTIRGLEAGPLYTRAWKNPTLQRLHPSAIATIVKAAVALVGLDVSEHAGHSLRSGLVTAAVENGISDTIIQSQTGHRSHASLRMYHRRANLFRANVSQMIGL